MWRMVSRAGALAQHRKLAFIDAHRAIFAGMIDADHGFGVRRRAGRFGLGLTRHFAAHALFGSGFDNPNAPSAAIRKEQMAL